MIAEFTFNGCLSPRRFMLCVAATPMFTLLVIGGVVDNGILEFVFMRTVDWDDAQCA